MFQTTNQFWVLMGLGNFMGCSIKLYAHKIWGHKCNLCGSPGKISKCLSCLSFSILHQWVLHRTSMHGWPNSAAATRLSAMRPRCLGHALGHGIMGKTSESNNQRSETQPGLMKCPFQNQIFSGKLTQLWKITIFHGQTPYFHGGLSWFFQLNLDSIAVVFCGTSTTKNLRRYSR